MKIKFSSYSIGIVLGIFVCTSLVGFAGAFYQQRHRLKGIAKAHYKNFFKNKHREASSGELVLEDSDQPRIVTVTINPSQNIAEINPLLYGANLSPKMESEADIINYVKKTGITCFRFPGGDSLGYHWKDGTFDFTNRFEKTPFRNLDYVIDFCRITGTKLIIQVNVESGTAKEAAEWVEYVNKKINLGIVYWELGNEVYGAWDKGFMNGKKYAQVIKEYATEMKKVDPNIKIGMDWATETRWFFNEEVVRTVGPYIDFVSVHWYPNNIDPAHKFKGRIHPYSEEVMANSLYVPSLVKGIRDTFRRLEPKRERPVEITFLEWDGAMDGPSSDYAPYSKGIAQWSLANAIFHADCLGMFAANDVAVATVFDFQSIGFGLIKGWDMDAGWSGQRWDGETVRPKALALELFARHFGDTLVVSKVTNAPYYFRKKDWSPDTYWGKVPYVSVYASTSAKSGKMYLVFINKHPENSYKLKVSILKAQPSFSGKLYLLTGPSLLSQNDQDPMTVRIKENEVRGLESEFTYDAPPHSVSVIETGIRYEE